MSQKKVSTKSASSLNIKFSAPPPPQKKKQKKNNNNKKKKNNYNNNAKKMMIHIHALYENIRMPLPPPLGIQSALSFRCFFNMLLTKL